MNILFEHSRIRRITTIAALIFLFFSAGVSLAFGAQPAPFEMMQLRVKIESKDAFLRFGDVFSNAGELSQTVLVRAPEPGRRVSLDPAWLTVKVRAHGRVWQNISGVKRVTVGRAGHRINTSQLNELIRQELEMRTNGAHYDIALANRTQVLFVPLDAKSEPRIISLDLTDQSGAFSARIRSYEGAPVTEIRGRAWSIIQVPTLIRSVRAGDEIMPENIQWTEVREASLRSGSLRDTEALGGKAARRALRANQPLRAEDLKRPSVIKKGEIILIVYAVPGIRLVTQARALGEAALGEPLRVVNLQSSRTIHVVATAPGQARANVGNTIGG